MYISRGYQSFPPYYVALSILVLFRLGNTQIHIIWSYFFSGSVNATCDDATGQCNCRPGIFGLRCDQLKPLHFGFSISGATPCDCDPTGSLSDQCDVNTGQCQCRDKVSCIINCLKYLLFYLSKYLQIIWWKRKNGSLLTKGFRWI